jgi:hypothetical protein
MNLSTKKKNQKKKSMTSTEVLKRNEKNLLAEIQSQETKRHKIETQWCISLNKENETLIQEKQQLMARLCSVKHDAKEQEQELLQCRIQQETIRLEVLEAFNNGVQYTPKEHHQTILLPEKLMQNH